MKKYAGYKIALFLVLAVTAAVLCALPFSVPKKAAVYIYTEQKSLNAKEHEFINELNHLGYEVKLNKKSFPDGDEIGLWFRPPEFAFEIAQSSAGYNFLYSREHYPFDWYNVKKTPVALTPHRDLYEHYMRSNVKTALFEFEKNNAHTLAKRFDILLKWLQKNKS